MLAHDLLGTPLPAPLLQAVQQECDDGIRELAARRILMAPDRVSEAVAHYAATPFGWSSIRAGVRQFLSPAQIAWRQGLAKDSPLIALHYPARMLDIVRRHGGKAVSWALAGSAERRAAQEQLVLAEWLKGRRAD
jgi:hypothetical protein